MSCTSRAKQLTRLPCLVVYVKFLFENCLKSPGNCQHGLTLGWRSAQARTKCPIHNRQGSGENLKLKTVFLFSEFSQRQKKLLPHCGLTTRAGPIFGQHLLAQRGSQPLRCRSFHHSANPYKYPSSINCCLTRFFPADQPTRVARGSCGVTLALESGRLIKVDTLNTRFGFYGHRFYLK